MSGGVDSSVAAALLKEQGYFVVGVHMKCFNLDGCGEKDAEDARRVAEQLGIPFYVFDFEQQYKDLVVKYMVAGYKKGITPNPDVMCNREIKFGLFLKKALSLGADFVATGHYVKLRKKLEIRNLKLEITIGYLYGDLMNIYGDTGNIIALKKRAEWHGIKVEVKNISVGDRIPTRQVGTQIDLFFFGGGQDQAQEVVAEDLIKSGKDKIIKSEVERGVPLLSICGGYQLLGEYYKPHKGPKLPGIGLFPTYTLASYDRMIGNIVIESMFGKLVGFENHSGKTQLKKGALPLGMVKKGFGNNGKDKVEGCIYKNAIGCYMHGSLLPKNPQLADWLIKKALEVKYKREINLKPLDDSIELQAHNVAVKRFS